MSQSLCGSAGLGHHESVSGDRFPYHRDSTLEHCEPGQFQWFGPEDGPRDDLDNPRDGDNNNDNEFVNALEELDPGLAVFHNLAIAINCLSCSSHQTNKSSSSCAKVREPDTFNGTDPKKLWTFLVQCELCFQDCAKVFCLDRAKITFAQSYLKGMTLEWFKPDLLNSGDLADQKDTHCITRYIMDFNCLASQVQDYGDGTLRHLFYSGLPDCLKDEIARVGKPLTLHGLQALCQEIDACYWECKDEIAHTTKSQSTSSPAKSSNSGGTSPKSGKEKSKAGNTSSSTPAGSSKTTSNPFPSGSTRLDLTNKLGKDGKLTADE